MILRILLITCAVFLAPASAVMKFSEFFNKYMVCFKNDESGAFRLLGQDSPLSNTLETFIALTEKFEAANPNIDLKDELNYFIKEYVFENVQILGGSLKKIHFGGRVDFNNIESIWDYDEHKPDHSDPFLDQEKCALYFMISHSILERDMDVVRSYTNESIFDKKELTADDYYPQEVGVVAVRGSDGPVALGKVLTGLHVGMKPERTSQLRSYKISVSNVTQETLDKNVDALYATTMADVLMLSAFDSFDRKGIAKNGQWISTPLPNQITSSESMEGFCPMVYKQEVVEGKVLPAYSYASVRGAADGLILGLTLPQIYSSDSKLSHILRMYYSQRGLIVNDQIQDLNGIRQVSFCNRESVIKVLEDNIKEQMLLYAYMVAIVDGDVGATYTRSISKYEEFKNDIFYNRGNSICTKVTSLDKPEDLTAETFLDIIVVMDSSNSLKTFIDQQLTIGYLAKQLDLRYHGSRMTILLDHRINSGTSGSSKIELKPVVKATYSTGCAACTVGQLNYQQSNVAREDIIIAVDQFLQAMKDNETSSSGVNGKVVIYFNYDNGDGRTNNNREQGNVQKALRDLNLRHRDVLLYAVGLDSELLKKYARDDPSLVFLGTDDKPEEIAEKIFKKIVYAPTLLQYVDCKDGRNERAATYETFVSPNKIQHYTMPAKYFYKSFNIKVLFESQDGQIRVCYNRATMKPENEAKYCKETSQGTAAEFKVSNPCKSFTKESCSPMYFAVIGKDPLAENNGNQPQRQRSSCKANDRMCSTLDQIKFRVSHEGIRCSGCLGLGAPPAVVLFAVLLTYLLHRKF